MADLALALPWVLLLLPLPLLARRLLPPCVAREEALQLPEAIAARAVPASGATARATPAPLLWALWAVLLLAIAQPERRINQPDRSATGRDIMLAIDLSGSMATEDFTLDGQTASRLQAVKQVAARFIAARRGDRIGLVIFADRAYVAAPLTHDLPAVVRALEATQIGLTGRATAIAEGLGLALKRITTTEDGIPSGRASDARRPDARTIVLLSDGRDTSDRLDAREVGRLAGQMGVRVHTIALGPEDLEERPAARDAVDTAALRAIAEASGGRSWRVRGLEDLTAMAAELDRVEPNPSTRPPVIVPEPLWIWPGAATFLLALAVALGEAGLLAAPRRAGPPPAALPTGAMDGRVRPPRANPAQPTGGAG